MKKLTKAQLKLEQEWQALLRRHSVPLEKGLSGRSPPSRASPSDDHRPSVSRKTVNSLVTPGHSTAPRQTTRYTGNSMLGVSTLHKSNSVPVFSKDDALDIARMRR